MNSILYSSILKVRPDASEAEIKTAYRLLARENHPDFFHDEYKDIQELKMMQINEAYNFLMATRKEGNKPSKSSRERKSDPEDYNSDWEEWERKRYKNLSSNKDIGYHKDPAYAYYKQGFINFSKGLNGIMGDRSIKRQANLTSLNRWASNSLKYFQEANRYFSRVVSEYPESIWSIDAEEKLMRIERFNALYRKILLNLKERLKKQK
jgi:curved DNA-binding protein CbpA